MAESLQVVNTGEKVMKKQMTAILFTVIIVLHLFVLVGTGAQKINYHVDEFLTFGLSNHSGQLHISFKDGKRYQGEKPFLNYLTVNHGNRFHYGNVWKNQSMDVHPPFYYSIIHTFSSFVPGVFSKWIGLIPNFIFMVIIDVLLFLTAFCIFRKAGIALLTVAINGVTLLNINMMMFIRMYAMLTACFLLVSTLHTIYFRRKKLDLKFYIGLFLGAVIGSMTQYYFLIFLFFLCLYFGIRLLCYRRWKEAAGYCATLALAGFTAVVFFPDMIDQIFGGGYRGQEAFSNLGTWGDYYAKLKGYYHILDDQLFGGEMVTVVIVIGIFLFLGCGKQIMRTSIWKKVVNHEISMMVFAAFGYFLLVVKIAPYLTERYIMPLGVYIVLMVIFLLYKAMCRCLPGERKSRVYICIGGIFAVCLILGQMRVGVSYTYADTKEVLQTAERYKDYPVLYVYDSSWKVLANEEELKRFNECTFTQQKNFGDVLRKRKEDKLILYIDAGLDNKTIIDQILEKDKNIASYNMLYKKDYANVYVLE